MQRALRNETVVQPTVRASVETSSEAAQQDSQEQRGWWQRFVASAFAARMWSAQREIDRHQEMILVWRRGLAERRGHLRPVTERAEQVSPHTGGERAGAQALGATGVDLGRTFINVAALFGRWRRRIRIRRELLGLSDTDLRDIRWTRAEVEAEGRKPFWRA